MDVFLDFGKVMHLEQIQSGVKLESHSQRERKHRVPGRNAGGTEKNTLSHMSIATCNVVAAYTL